MGSNTNVPIIIFIFTFYIFLFTIMGLVNNSMNTNTYRPSSVTVPTQPDTQDFSAFDLLIGIPIFIWHAIETVFQGMAFTITGIPVIFSTLLFTPLAITLWVVGMNYLRGNS